MHLSAYQATKKLRVSSDTLCHWLKQGKITAKISPSGVCLYNISFFFPKLTSDDVGNTSAFASVSASSSFSSLKEYLYICISSTKQKDDLK
ncbi:hypothetical protein BC936DRAFT_145941 [Jimgerdemannia flammicorona]|uniref:Uncharacterized protein n=1 Tax=Jimgerdemannia flammicorona TaxID=994334 RepID=A0A433D9F7_9FUNG|nr:hypothetical protein BC936DRAFT_145941 [Jimgerdemannia flammicorona]